MVLKEDSVKKKNKSKAKGSAFERKVCKLLSLWVSDGIRDDLYWRSAMSGGRASVRFKKGGQKSTNQAGDLTAIDPLGKSLLDVFCIECKTYKSLHFKSLLFLKPKDQSFVSFWKQTTTTAHQHDRLPMLIAKQKSNVETLICIDPKGLQQLNSRNKGYFMSDYLYSDKLKMYIFILEDFVYMFDLRKPAIRKRLK